MNARPSARLDGVGDRLFVYGTLQFGPVLEALLGRTPDHDLAVAPGHRVAALPGRLYPGLVPRPGRMAGGLVLNGLTRAEWETIDAFEDDEYHLEAIPLIGYEKPVPTYLWTADVTRNDWLAEVFATDHLDRYLARLTRAGEASAR
ncbi:gamma-glutamylcyclotransferase family protein [Nocardia blacklockiae]|uniref:gamma-glutamylcyclotransferase family protein n=1 Tax=Nocardia blacklockiae TaxID=480036 RepID=UPI002B4AF019|nr:gamma-glutamylcyclotransferase family protein [Nocardia blacklockiae]